MSRSYIGIAIAALASLLAACVLAAVGMRETTWRYEYRSVGQIPAADIAIVLGASVVRGKPSPILAARADAAIALYRAKKVSTILVTGDAGSRGYDEVTPVRNYLQGAGVKAQDIVLDPSGFDTYSSMYRALHVFGVRSATVVTQDFHMPRALWIGRHLGMNVNGLVASDVDGPLWDYVREIPASLKALLDVVRHRLPRVLGT